MRKRRLAETPGVFLCPEMYINIYTYMANNRNFVG